MTETYTPVPLDWQPRGADDMLRRSREFRDLMRQRRSVRQFAPDPVPFEVIENAIATAGSAPSGANQQPWTFVVVSDRETKRRMREAAEAEERTSYDHRMSQEWLRALAHLGTDWHKPHLTDAPYVIVVFEQVYGVRPDGSRYKHYYARESVGIAVGLLVAALHYAGLATLTHTPSPMGFLRDLLGRPANERPFVVIPVGYPAADCMVPQIDKKALDEIMVRVSSIEY
jgi:iodotyrosine deiodinase